MIAKNILSTCLDDSQWAKAPDHIRHLGPDLERTLEGLYAVVRILRVNDSELVAYRESGGEDGEALDDNLTSGLHAAAEALAWDAHLALSKIRDAVAKESGVRHG